MNVRNVNAIDFRKSTNLVNGEKNLYFLEERMKKTSNELEQNGSFKFPTRKFAEKVFRFGRNHLLILCLLLANSPALPQTQKSQIPQPAFLPPNEQAIKLINDRIYLVVNKPQEHSFSTNGKNYSGNYSDTNTSKLYFTDAQEKILNTFAVFPSNNVVNAVITIKNTKKFLAVRRSYSDTGKNITDGFIFDDSGRVLWHISTDDLIGEIFINDNSGTLAIVDPLKGYLKVFDINGIEKVEKYFTDQNDLKFPQLKTEDLEDLDFQESAESSEDGNYIAVYRVARDLKNFQSELTLFDSAGNITFQNRAPLENVGTPLKLLSDLKLIIALGDVKGTPSYGAHRGHDEYFGINFKGEKIWELDGERFFLDPRDLSDAHIKIQNVQKIMDKSGRRVIDKKTSPSNQVINIKTGEVK